MKKLILFFGLIISLLATSSLSAQTEGKISYEIKVNMHRTLPPEREEMKQMIPEFNVHHDCLFFKEAESYYSPVEDEPDEDEISQGGMTMKFRRPEIEVYNDNSKALKISRREYFGKYYLIKDSIKIHPWKLLDGTKTVKGYECKSASFVDTRRNQKIVAWYTDKIRPYLGPEYFNTLPGTVLQIDINEGERLITAEKIEFAPLKKGDIKIPTSGTQVSEEGFVKIVEETQKKMGGQNGIIIRTN